MIFFVRLFIKNLTNQTTDFPYFSLNFDRKKRLVTMSPSLKRTDKCLGRENRDYLKSIILTSDLMFLNSTEMFLFTFTNLLSQHQQSS
jgi:hypothetical protein